MSDTEDTVAPSLHPRALHANLEPAVEEYGELHTIQGGDAYLAVNSSSSSSSRYQFQVYPRAEVHGRMTLADGESTAPASLLLLHVHAIPGKRSRPLKWASVQITFEHSADAPEGSPRPEVVKFAPGATPVKLEPSQESQSTTSSAGTSAGLNVGGGPAGANLNFDAHKERSRSKEQLYSAWVEGWSKPSDDRKPQRPNLAGWSLTQNASQQSSIPPRVAVALLLKRPEGGDFRCNTKIEVEVKSRPSLRDKLAKFSHWMAATEYQTFTVDEQWCIYEQGDLADSLKKSVDPQHLEKVLKHGALDPFVKISMPETQQS